MRRMMSAWKAKKKNPHKKPKQNKTGKLQIRDMLRCVEWGRRQAGVVSEGWTGVSTMEGQQRSLKAEGAHVQRPHSSAGTSLMRGGLGGKSGAQGRETILCDTVMINT